MSRTSQDAACFLVLFCSMCICWMAPSAAAWDPDAGLVWPLANSTRTVAVSSNNVPDISRIIDNNDQTAWQSGACFPSSFIGRPDMNPLLNATSNLQYAATNGSNGLWQSFDASFYTGGYVAAVSGQAFLNITFKAPTPIYRVYWRAYYNSGVAKILLIHQNGTASTVAQGLNSTINWVDQVVIGNWDSVIKVSLLSTGPLTLTELGVQNARCTEWAAVDMKAVQSVNLIRARWWSPDATATVLETSVDGSTWTTVANNLQPNALPSADFWFDTPIQAQYIRIKHWVTEQNWKKVYAWEISAYGKGGRYGVAPPAVPQTNSFRKIMGVNGIWQWGGGSPLLYSAAASSGRNYEDAVWDIQKPGNDPKYDTMSKTGTDGQWWLDWDKEYSAWKKANLSVHVSWQFHGNVWPPSYWPSPYANAYDIGYKFARHFGPTAGTGNVVAFEAGNEPWDYNATFYTTLLRGFMDGALAGDPAVKRLPCALQAFNPLSESGGGGNYIGARVPADLAPKISALNTHTYSWLNSQNGSRVGVHPEHPGSSMNELNNFLVWRNANMPGVPVYVTEWGWDGRRPGEDCGGATECVSQLAQAAYGIRGLALMARKGIEQSHWFFYANDKACKSLFCRSGLRDIPSTGFAELPVYRAFKAFMQIAGSSCFKSVVMETPAAYVYLFSSQAGMPSHVMAWRPISVSDVQNPADVTSVNFDLGFAAVASTSFALTGESPNGGLPAALPAISGTSWTMPISGIPTLVSLA